LRHRSGGKKNPCKQEDEGFKCFHHLLKLNY
jgi:hypothetical protein